MNITRKSNILLCNIIYLNTIIFPESKFSESLYNLLGNYSSEESIDTLKKLLPNILNLLKIKSDNIFVNSLQKFIQEELAKLELI